MPNISIVIPTYNRANSIRSAIESALNQTCHPKEIIVVDDGSTDNTASLLKEYSNKIKYIYQKNKGVSAARNTGINNSSGDWIAFLDSDDEWKPNKLEIQMDYINSHPDIVAHVTNAFFMGKNYSFNYFNERRFFESDLDDGCIKRPLITCLTNFFLVPTCMVKNSILSQAGLFNEKMAIFEDGDFFTRLALCGPWGVSFEPLLLVYRREDDTVENLSAINKSKRIYTVSNQIFNAYSLLGDNRIADSERNFIRGRLSSLLYDRAMIEKEGRQTSTAIRTWRESLRHDLSLKTLLKGVLLLLPYNMNNSIRSLFRKLTRNDTSVMRSNDD